MIDLSSEQTTELDMASELIAAKIETAKKDTQMTHIMRIGTFHMELAPDRDIDVKEIFDNTLEKLIKKFGDKLLEINVQQLQTDKDTSRHYG